MFAWFSRRAFSTTNSLCKKQAGRYKPSKHKGKHLTYEQACPPYLIAHWKSWLSWNTGGMLDGVRTAETVMDDMFIRKFMFGTFHRLFLTEVIVKRRHNMIYVGGVIDQSTLPRKIYFLTGYTEELLSYVLKCPVKLELQSVPHRDDVTYRIV
ncbi:28S ribosomal protein S24, mitochondrial [Galendromus occidentalis]|uniref:28S ribosomal protein S24, mitochondrial n=1 Tax=Galendromus occidentalis TaxID=34638 RepID=A0AAJ6QNX1_9ACAR|nr:28S ribosomal protein S24, mitochondrial [Galendromus occidentalis]